MLNVSKAEADEAVANNSVEIVEGQNVVGIGFVEDKKKEFIELGDGKIIDKEKYEEAEYQKFKGICERDFNFNNPADFNSICLPEKYWDKLKKEVPSVKEGFEEYYKNKKEIIKETIELPESSLISEFAKKLVNKLKKEGILFYRQDARQVVELGIIKDNKGKILSTGFIPVEPSRFVTLIEKYFQPWTFRFTKTGGKFKIEKSMNTSVAKIVLESQIFQENLPPIKRIFPVQIPIIYEGKLTFPTKGYDFRFNSWLPYDAPKISNPNMSLEEAKKIIYEFLKEFCFEARQDYINSISALLTPFLKGLFKTGFNTRTPVFVYESNRERSGKDYLAGITGILYEGHALEEPPISSGEKRGGNSNDELRKKIIGAMIQGRRRLHFSNNKGYLNNSVFESVTTAEKYSDRILGKNNIVTLDNEIDYSLSGNIGITFTPDLANRSIFIRLFLDIEDANLRRFENPILHKWILENRNLIISALFSLVKNWFNKKCPNGNKLFSSFPEWAFVCGGIMECAGYDNPCSSNKDNIGISIDGETEEMKELFELCYKRCGDRWLTKEDIRKQLEAPGEILMSYYDWGEKSSQTKFGMKLNRYVGRVLSNIRLIIEDKTIRPGRWKYKFTKTEVEKDKNAIFFKN